MGLNETNAPDATQRVLSKKTMPPNGFTFKQHQREVYREPSVLPPPPSSSPPAHLAPPAPSPSPIQPPRPPHPPRTNRLAGKPNAVPGAVVHTAVATPWVEASEASKASLQRAFNVEVLPAPWRFFLAGGSCWKIGSLCL